MKDPWKIRQNSFDVMEIGKNESLFTLGNGNLGLRGNLEEAQSNYQRGTYINGFYETFPIKYGKSAYGYARQNQTIVNLADIEIVSILSDDSDEDAADKRDTTEDPRIGLASGKKILHRRDVFAQKTRAYMIHQTEGSGKSLFSGMDHSFLCNSTSVINNYISRTEAAVSFSFKNAEGTVQLVKYLCYRHGQRKIEDELKSNGLDDLDYCLLQGFEYYLSAQRSFLADFWDQTDVVIKGDSELQFGIRFNLFHLLQSFLKKGDGIVLA